MADWSQPIFCGLAATFLVVALPSYCWSATETDFKEAVLEDCQRAEKTFSGLDDSQKVEMVEYLGQVLKLNLTAQVQAVLGAPAVNLPQPAHLSGLEPIPENLWRGFNPVRESNAKACSAKLLALVPEYSRKQLTSLIKAANDTTVTHQARTTIRTSAISIARHSNKVPPDELRALIDELGEPGLKSDVEMILIILPREEVTAAVVQELGAGPATPQVMASAINNLSLDERLIEAELLILANSTDRASQQRLIEILKLLRTPPGNLLEVLTAGLTVDLFASSYLEILANALGSGWKSPCDTSERGAACLAYVRLVADSLIKEERALSPSLKSLETAASIAQFEPQVAQALSPSLLEVFKRPDSTSDVKSSALQIIAAVGAPSKSLIDLAKSIIKDNSVDPQLSVIATLILSKNRDTAPDAIKRLVSLSEQASIIELALQMPLNTPSEIRQFINVVLALPEETFASIVTAIHKRCPEFAAQLKLLPEQRDTTLGFRQDYWKMQCGIALTSGRAKAIARSLQNSICSIKAVELALMPKLISLNLLPADLASKLDSCLIEPYQLNQVRAALLLSNSNPRLRTKLAEIYQDHSAALDVRLAIFAQRRSAGIVDLEPSVLLPQMAEASAEQRLEFIQSLEGAPSSGADVSDWLAGLIDDDELNSRTVCAAATEVAQRQRTPENRREQLQDLLDSKHASALLNCPSLTSNKLIIDDLWALARAQVSIQLLNLLATLPPTEMGDINTDWLWEKLKAEDLELQGAALYVLLANADQAQEERLEQQLRLAIHTPIRTRLLSSGVPKPSFKLVEQISRSPVDRLESVVAAQLLQPEQR